VIYAPTDIAMDVIHTVAGKVAVLEHVMRRIPHVVHHLGFAIAAVTAPNPVLTPHVVKVELLIL